MLGWTRAFLALTVSDATSRGVPAPGMIGKEDPRRAGTDCRPAIFFFVDLFERDRNIPLSRIRYTQHGRSLIFSPLSIT